MGNRGEGQSSDTGRRGYKRPPDSLEAEVRDALQADGQVDASGIDVHVEDGTVTLKGTVTSADQQRLAETCARSVLGINDVRNLLTVGGDMDDTQRGGDREFGQDSTVANRPARTIGITPQKNESE